MSSGRFTLRLSDQENPSGCGRGDRVPVTSRSHPEGSYVSKQELLSDLAEIRRWHKINLMSWLEIHLERIEQAVHSHVPDYSPLARSLAAGAADARQSGDTSSVQSEESAPPRVAVG